jgi:predicted outer membrane protein
MTHLIGAVVAIAVSAVISAPVAAAADNSTCVATGGATDCQAPGNAQIYAAPHALPASGGRSNPKWQPLGYNPKWNGFQP